MDGKTAQGCYSGLLATGCKKSSNRASSSRIIGSRRCKGIDIKNTWTNGLSWLPDRENTPK